jgi:hypothetical protein
VIMKFSAGRVMLDGHAGGSVATGSVCICSQLAGNVLGHGGRPLALRYVAIRQRDP